MALTSSVPIVVSHAIIHVLPGYILEVNSSVDNITELVDDL